LDRTPLWRGDHVAVRQLVEDFGRYHYLPRLRNATVLLDAIQAGVSTLTWELDTFAYADSYDEAAGRYRGLRTAEVISISVDSGGLLVKPEVARKQLDAEVVQKATIGTVTGTVGSTSAGGMSIGGGTGTGAGGSTGPSTGSDEGVSKAKPKPRRFYGSVILNPTRAGRDASKVAEEVITHLVGLLGANVRITLEIEADIPNGTPDNVVRIVTENSRELKFNQASFEEE
jgi:hypothetical protein